MAAKKLKSFASTEEADRAVRKVDTALSLLSGNEAGGEYKHVRLDTITLNPANHIYNADDNEDVIIALAEDISRNGLLHNIVLSERSDGTNMLISGERRVRAYRHLQAEHPGEEKYKTIYAMSFPGLTERQEVLRLDAANLQARGAAGSEGSAKGIVRFIENLAAEYGFTELEARKFLVENSQISAITALRAVNIETRLHPELKEMLETRSIKSHDAEGLAVMPEDLQQQVADVCKTIKNKTERKAYVSEALACLRQGRSLADAVIPNIKPKQEHAQEAGDEPTILQKRRHKYVTAFRKINRTLKEAERKYVTLKELDREAGEGEDRICDEVAQIIKLGTDLLSKIYSA